MEARFSKRHWLAAPLISLAIFIVASVLFQNSESIAVGAFAIVLGLLALVALIRFGILPLMRWWIAMEGEQAELRWRERCDALRSAIDELATDMDALARRDRPTLQRYANVQSEINVARVMREQPPGWWSIPTDPPVVRYTDSEGRPAYLFRALDGGAAPPAVQLRLASAYCDLIRQGDKTVIASLLEPMQARLEELRQELRTLESIGSIGLRQLEMASDTFPV